MPAWLENAKNAIGIFSTSIRLELRGAAKRLKNILFFQFQSHAEKGVNNLKRAGTYEYEFIINIRSYLYLIKLVWKWDTCSKNIEGL